MTSPVRTPSSKPEGCGTPVLTPVGQECPTYTFLQNPHPLPDFRQHFERSR